jgi:hypothetical protein
MVDRKTVRVTLEFSRVNGQLLDVYSDAQNDGEHAIAQRALAKIIRSSESGCIDPLLASFGLREGKNLIYKGNVNAG